MQAQRIDNMFNFTFEKSAAEIIGAADHKRTEVAAKIEERITRITDMRSTHKVTDAVLLDIQNQMRAQAKRGMEAMSYTSNVRGGNGGAHDEDVTVGAGVINFLITEQDFIDAEKSQVEKLTTIINNLKDITKYTPAGAPYVEKFKIGFDELKYLGF